MFEIWPAVKREAEALGLSTYDKHSQSEIVAAVVQRFVRDPESNWWWQALKVDSSVLTYEGTDGLPVLRELLPQQGLLTLIVTNESPVPEGTVEGSAAELIQVLKESPGFEFAIVPRDFAWIVFDTHHNRLVYAGSLRA